VVSLTVKLKVDPLIVGLQLGCGGWTLLNAELYVGNSEERRALVTILNELEWSKCIYSHW